MKKPIVNFEHVNADWVIAFKYAHPGMILHTQYPNFFCVLCQFVAGFISFQLIPPAYI